MALLDCYDFDESKWPTLKIAMIRKPDDDEFRAYLEAYEDYLTRGERYGVIYDVNPAVGMISVSQARMQAHWMEKYTDRLRKACYGVAFVLPSAVHRGALKAILRMQPMPTPYKVVPTLDDANAWLQQAATTSTTAA